MDEVQRCESLGWAVNITLTRAFLAWNGINLLAN